jgi:hypothetical protein
MPTACVHNARLQSVDNAILANRYRTITMAPYLRGAEITAGGRATISCPDSVTYWQHHADGLSIRVVVKTYPNALCVMFDHTQRAAQRPELQPRSAVKDVCSLQNSSDLVLQ